MKTEFSQIEQQQIIDDYINKVDIDIIIKKYNTDEHYIRLILKEHQIDRQYNTFTKELENRVIYYYKQNILHKDISYNLLVSGTGINKIIDRNQIPRIPYTIRNRHIKRDSYYFDNIDTPNKAYTLGLIYADGNNFIGGRHHTLTIVLQEEDRDVLERIREELKYDAPLKYTDMKKKKEVYHNTYRLVVNDEYMCNRLLELGVVNNKSLIVKFPNYISDELIPHFIRGYFDGDGSVYYDDKRSKAGTSICGTYDFVSHISEILHNMGIKNHLYHPKQCGDNDTYVVVTTGNKSSYSFLTWMYQDADIKMERKYNKYLYICEKYNKEAA